jgi:hypothetical protein
MKIKAVVFLVIVLFFSYQNCSQKNLSGPIGQKTEDASIESQSLSDLQVQQVKFYTEQNSEMQKGSHKFLVRTKKNYVLDPETGVLAEHDQATGDLNTYCLSHELLIEMRSIISRSSVCRSGPVAQSQIACAQVVLEPYAEIVTVSDVIQLGSASDACGSNKIDLCEDQSTVLKGWIETVHSQLPQLTCGQ